MRDALVIEEMVLRLPVRAAEARRPGYVGRGL
jgi:hypothetical protein